MKIIFLDIDGVLNSQVAFKSGLCKHVEIDNAPITYQKFYPEYKERLNKLIKKHNAKIVISSTWRTYWKLDGMKRIWENEGMEGEIIGVTGSSSNGFRGCEIDDYIKRKYGWILSVHPEVVKIQCDKIGLKNYVIIDDDGDMTYYQRFNFCHTRNETGFTEEAFNKADEILDRNLWDICLF